MRGFSKTRHQLGDHTQAPDGTSQPPLRQLRGAYDPSARVMYERMRPLLKEARHCENHAIRYFELAEAVNSLRPESILEIGCGYGFGSTLFNARTIVSLDIDPIAVRYARSHSAQGGQSFIVADVFNVDFRRQFDVVVFSEVIEHVRDHVGMIRKCHGMLKPDGKLVATVPNLNRLQNGIRRTLGIGPVFMSDEHLREYSLVPFLRMLDTSGFDPTWWRGVFFRLPFDDQAALIPGLEMRSPIRESLERSFPRLCTYFLICANRRGGSGE